MTIENIWANGGGLASIPKRFNDRNITPDMFNNVSYKEKLKLLKEHQQNNE